MQQKHQEVNDGSYDCLVPGSGGKDSAYQAHILKYKYKMNPLTVTWPPILYTDYGLRNWRNWLDAAYQSRLHLKSMLSMLVTDKKVD